jgi:hypothetical protein
VAQEAGGTRAGVAAAGAAARGATLPDPRIAQVRALIARSLDIAVDPQSLFDVPLADERALQVEAVRASALVRAADEVARALPVATTRGRRALQPPPDAGALRAQLASVDSALWADRIELDRARLEFYALGGTLRGELLRAHSARQDAARPRESDDHRRVREAEADRQAALAAARAARTEAERLVSEELARLIGVGAQVSAARDRFGAAREQLRARRDIVLGWQRRVRDAVAMPADADATYDALRRALRTSREDLAIALDALSEESSEVPTLGEDALAEIPAGIATEHVRERRLAVGRAIAAARDDERALRSERAAALLDEMDDLNRMRLGLLAHLSPAKRGAITGFTSAGWDQARSEARHLSLISQYHRQVVRTWIGSLRAGGPSGISAWKTAAVVVPWLILLAGFVWGRRQSPKLLRYAELRLAAADRAARRTAPSPERRAVRILARVHRPLEWIGFFAATTWILPASAASFLEVQLVASVIGWILGGALVVNAINAFAAGAGAAPMQEGATGVIRLRSLRLVGRTVVLFALVLVVSSRLVGEGTIYSWVFSTCWFASIPVSLVLVRWWRGIVFERMESSRRKSRAQAWVLSHRSGWTSFLGAMVGAVHLFGMGVIKTVRTWISKFDLARRVHAYLFKREIERLGEARAEVPRVPLCGAAFDALHPECPYSRWLASPNDQALDGLHARIQAGSGGLVALIGARGMGKSSFLQALRARVEGAASIRCGPGTSRADVAAAARIDGAGGASRALPRLVVLDDAHALVKPVIGGLEAFDEVSSLARAHCSATTWLFALDASVWPLLRRARDARPLFDRIVLLEAWDEKQIGALLADRCASAGIAPCFEDLLEKLPVGADELDRQDALQAKQAGYERMLWDHVRGNPALALEAWRLSLAVDAVGGVHVRPLQVPDAGKLDTLPDSSLFVLRAVLQLAPAAVDDVAQATRLSPDQVLNAFRFGQTQGFFAEQEGRICVSWPWLRPVVRLLERRHLLVIS